MFASSYDHSRIRIDHFLSFDSGNVEQTSGVFVGLSITGVLRPNEPPGFCMTSDFNSAARQKKERKKKRRASTPLNSGAKRSCPF